MTEQGFEGNDNVVHQDDQSAVLLEWNGRASSGRCSQHCATEEMLNDFFTKPLQGSLFRHLRAQIMNLPDTASQTVTAAGSQELQECVGVWCRSP
jgi:hypothetical protein